jgi:hypothetical protein
MASFFVLSPPQKIHTFNEMFHSMDCKKFLQLIFSFGTIFLFVDPAQGQAWLSDPLYPIYPDSNDVRQLSRNMSLDFPRNGIADVHLLVRSNPGSSIRIEARINGRLENELSLSQLIDVPVEQNTGVDSRTEQFKNLINPDVIRRAPFRIFEAILPVKSPSTISTAKYTAFRISLPSQYAEIAGRVKTEIFVEINGKKHRLLFTANIHEKEVPSLRNSRFFYTNWFRLAEIEKRHGVQRWSEGWYNMLEKYVSLMAHGRQNAIIIPGELIYFENGKLILEEEKMIRYIDLCRKYGFQYFESPHLMHRGKMDDWNDPILKTIYSDAPYYTEQGIAEIKQVITAIKSFTAKYDLTNAWMQHISDEPTARQGKCYRDIVKQVKAIYPEIRIMEATNDRDSIAGAIDIWCPLINDFQENESFFRQREKFREKVLVYTCLIPGGKWLNRLLDQERLRQVYFGWGAAKYNTFGYLHWGLNQYHADPWTQSVVHHSSPAAGANNFLPAGDTHIIYPGEDGPLSSVRFEAHRLGIEDYELLMIQRAKDPGSTDALIRRLFKNYTDYSIDITTYRKARKKLLKG